MTESRATGRLSFVMGVHPLARVAGAVLTAVSLFGIWNLATATSPPMDAAKVRVLVAILFLVGDTLLFGFRGAVIDAVRGRVLRWWGPTLLGLVRVPLFWLRHDLSAFTSVVRRRAVHTSSTDGVEASYDTFPVVLDGKVRRAVKVWEGHSLLRARRRAEAIARLLRLPLVDEVDDGPIRTPDELDLDALERLMGKQPLPPEPSPAPARIRVEETADGVAYEIAPDRRLPVGYKPVRVALEKETLILRRPFWVERTIRIPLARVEEIHLASSALMVVGDELRVSFETGLLNDDAAWLVSDILRRWWTRRFGQRPIYR